MQTNDPTTSRHHALIGLIGALGNTDAAVTNSQRNTSTLWQGKNEADTRLRTDHSDLSSSPSAVCWKRMLGTLSSSGNRS
jgi:hypothetical protein